MHTRVMKPGPTEGPAPAPEEVDEERMGEEEAGNPIILSDLDLNFLYVDTHFVSVNKS